MPPLRTLARLIRALGRGDRVLRRLRDAPWGVATGLLGTALTAEERGRVTVHLYDGDAPGGPPVGELYDWERAWYTRRLPPSPGPILVGGAGEGREVAALLAQGYQVDAFEPAAIPAARLARLLAGRGRAVAASYDDLVHRRGPAAALAETRYAAVILGWGSFTHLLTPEAHRATLDAAHTSTPDGPILASLYLGSRGPRDRATRLGETIGAALAHLRGIPGAPLDGTILGPTGFGYAFEREEIEALARGIGRKVIWETDPGFPHVTLLPVR